MKKIVEHTHPDPTVFSDAELVEHVQTAHQVPPDQPWLLNDANRELLLTQHAQAHHADPISFPDDLPVPPWAQRTAESAPPPER